jgi:molybdopterin synthase catalytic subunit
MSEAGHIRRLISVQASPFDLGAEVGRLTQSRTDIGAVVTFTGLCRDEAGQLSALELEHYPGMAEDEMSRVVAQAEQRWPLQAVSVIHRYGVIRPGEVIVLVVTASVHRVAAFEAATFLMDYLKTRAPFWKKEHLADGSIGGWVEAKAHDDLAAERWSAAQVPSVD